MTALALIEAEDADLLAGLASDLLAEHRIVPKALPHMLQRVMEDDDLRHAAMVALIEGECRRTLEAAMATRYQAEKRRSGSGPIGPARSSNIEAWAGAVANSLMDDFRLPGGKRLGDANRADLETAMASYQILAADAGVKHRWLRLVLQSLPSGKTVRQHLTDDRLAELRVEARKGE